MRVGVFEREESKMRHYLFVLSAVGFMFVAAGSAMAGGPGAPCGGCGEVTYVEKTCYAPEWVTETRTVTVCEYAQEQREIKQIVNKCVPVQKQVQRVCTVMVPEQRTKMCQYTVCRPVVQQVERQYTVCVPQWRDEVRQYTAYVPTVETRQGVRRVCKTVTEDVVKTVCVDRGHWETQMVEVSCVTRRCGLFGHRGCGGCCDPCCTTTVCQKCWVPNVVQEQVTVTVCKPQIVEEPCEYTVTVCKPEVRNCTVKVCDWKQEVRTMMCNVTTYESDVVQKEVTYTVCVPQQKTWTETVTCYETQAEEVTRTVTVCVPHQVQKEVQVNVCRMVPKTVQVPVQCGGGCCRGCGLFACRRGCGC
jgi:hypothetical protein